MFGATTVTLQLKGLKGSELLNRPILIDISEANLVSDNPAIATVDAVTGVVTAVAAGAATITATYGGFTSDCMVEVVA
jgi:hypothetical protein